MRLLLAALTGLCIVALAQGQRLGTTRYNLDYDYFNYPQLTPKQTMTSAVKALQEKKLNYLLAHLTDPAFIDQRVQDVHGGKFAGIVKEVSDKFINDPEAIKLLERFAKDGDWEDGETTASVKLKGTKDRVYFRKVETRWFMQNQKQPEKTEKPAEKPAEKQEKGDK